jgi:hypothetical protein
MEGSEAVEQVREALDRSLDFIAPDRRPRQGRIGRRVSDASDATGFVSLDISPVIVRAGSPRGL